MSPKSLNHIVKANIVGLGVDPKTFGSHSLRAGGATEAATKGVDTYLIKRHGRWKSDAVYLYIHDTIKEKLKVSSALCL